MHCLMGASRKHLGTFTFLQPGWWVTHIVGSILLLTIGYCLCTED